jgi:hypothetical protein
LGSENRKKFLPRKEWMNETTPSIKATEKGNAERWKDEKEREGEE